MKVTYYYGYISKFDKLNVHTTSPHKIIFSKYGYNLYLIPNENEPFTIGSMKKYIKWNANKITNNSTKNIKIN